MNFKTKLNNALIVIAIPLAAVSMNAQADILHQDDVIITSSACIGNDCTNGEVFGFDTLRLKENNLRIKFQDTSNSASFPGADWEITANDSTNGGANYLAFTDVTTGRQPFRVDADARSNALYVTAGRVGLGTNTPLVELHMVDGNSPTLRLEQDGTSGFSPQTWDVAGNETNFFIRDVTNGSRLPFKIKPGANTNLLYLDANERIGVNTNSPSATLDVVSTRDEVTLETTTASRSWPAADVVLENTSGQNASLNLLLKSDKVPVLGFQDPTPDVGRNDQWYISLRTDGDLWFSTPRAPRFNPILKLSADGTVTVNGNLVVNGQVITN